MVLDRVVFQIDFLYIFLIFLAKRLLENLED